MDKITLTEKELQAFFLEAYNKGREAKNICGSLSKIDKDSYILRKLTFLTFYETFNKQQRKSND